MFVSQEQAQQRYNICKACENFKTISKRCGKCGCFMKAKVTFCNSTCPLAKWPRLNPLTQKLHKVE